MLVKAVIKVLQVLEIQSLCVKLHIYPLTDKAYPILRDWSGPSGTNREKLTQRSKGVSHTWTEPQPTRSQTNKCHHLPHCTTVSGKVNAPGGLFVCRKCWEWPTCHPGQPTHGNRCRLVWLRVCFVPRTVPESTELWRNGRILRTKASQYRHCPTSPRK